MRRLSPFIVGRAYFGAFCFHSRFWTVFFGVFVRLGVIIFVVFEFAWGLLGCSFLLGLFLA